MRYQQKTIEWTLDWALYLFAGVFACLLYLAALPTIIVILKGESWGAGESVAFLGDLFNIRLLFTGSAVASLILLKTYLSGGMAKLKLDTMKSSNLLLYILAFGIVFPPVPAQLVILMIITILALSPKPQYRVVGRNFKLALSFFILLVLAGILSSVIGLSEIRSNIPMGRQLWGPLPYISAFVVYYTVRRNNWGLKEIDTFLKIIVIGCSFVTLEALLTWYIGRDTLLPGIGLGVSVMPGGLFKSALIGSHHHAARIGLITFFSGLYFRHRYDRPLFFIATVIGFLLMVATLNRAPLLASIGGLSMFMILTRSHSGMSRRGIMLRGLLATAGLIFGAYFLLTVFQQVTDVRGASSMSRVYESRLIHHARALDVLIETPLMGTGPMQDPYYQGSSLVEPRFFNAATSFLGVDPNWALLRIAPEDLHATGIGFTAHSLWLEVAMHWGIWGIAGLIYLCFMALSAIKELRKNRSKEASVAWILLIMSISISVSMLTTSKFRVLWLFVMLFTATAIAIRELDWSEETA